MTRSKRANKGEVDSEISIGHGSGGAMTRDLIKDLFQSSFDNDILDRLSDSAVLNINSNSLAFTTDSYVVDPVFFPGGNIGKLAICGTVNDLAVSGSVPAYITAGFIIEEGFSISQLKEIIQSMASEAREAGVKIVAGDTKVVNRGKCDKIFINTSGIGVLKKSDISISTAGRISPGDKILINGPIGDHAIAILKARGDLGIELEIESDCASLNDLISRAMVYRDDIKFMRDATRGGLATVLVELAEMTGSAIEVSEPDIPVRESVKNVCEILGFDPLYLANEGKVVMVVSQQNCDLILKSLRSHKLGKESNIIGEIVSINKGEVVLKTMIGGRRQINMLASDQLPRIC